MSLNTSNVSKTSNILTGLKITGLTLAVTIIIAMIITILLSYYCIGPFKSLLIRCAEPPKSPCEKWEEPGCDPKCDGNSYKIPAYCKWCKPGEILYYNKCISECRPDEVYSSRGCVKRICNYNEIQVENNLCIPDISGFYYEKNSNGEIIGKHEVETKHESNVAPVLSGGRNIIIDAINGELIGINGLKSTDFDDVRIIWEDGTRWEKHY